MDIRIAFAHPTVSLAIAIATTTFGAGPALAQGASAPAPKGSAEAELAAAQEEARVLAERAASAALIDTTPPALRRINITGNVNAQQVGQSVDADIQVTDNLSGVVYYYVSLRSP